MGVGPMCRAMALRSLVNGRFLFTLEDGPWKRRICLHLLSAGLIELAIQVCAAGRRGVRTPFNDLVITYYNQYDYVYS